jgi:hypothetical protein
MTVSGQSPCQFTIPAAQVEDRLVPVQRIEDAPYAWLKASARGRKGPPEVGVELAVEFDQALGNVCFHGLIISGYNFQHYKD